MRNPNLSESQPTEWTMQIGPHRYPSWGALTTDPEKMWSLQQAVGTHQSVFHTNALNLEHWDGSAGSNSSHIIAVLLDKIQTDSGEDGFAGLSTKMGDLVTFCVKNVNASCQAAWTVIKFSQILVINEEGCQLLE